MSCGCQPGVGTWDAYIACAAVAPQPLVDDNELQNYAASAGCSSSNWSMCYAVACMKTRRLIYWRVNPGDCGSGALGLNSSTVAEAQAGRALGTAASVDPEPISQGILTGLANIFGGFTAHHAAAVNNEETTMCQVSTNYNQAAQAIEQAVKQGTMSPAQAGALIQQVAQQLDPVMQSIAIKTGDFGYYARYALRALVQYNVDIVYDALAPATILPVLVSTPIASPGAPGTSGAPYQTGGSILSPAPVYPTPPEFPSSPSTYAGASGPIVSPLTGNNAGSGATVPFLSGFSFSNPFIILLVLLGVVVLSSGKHEAKAA